MYQPVFALITIKTPAQLDSLNMQTYVLGAVAGILFLGIAALIAHLIKFEGGQHPKDPGRRRMWFWALFAGTFTAFFLYNRFLVAETVNPNLQSDFMTAMLTGCGIACAIYLALGFVMSKAMSRSKIGNWFNK